MGLRRLLLLQMCWQKSQRFGVGKVSSPVFCEEVNLQLLYNEAKQTHSFWWGPGVTTRDRTTVLTEYVCTARSWVKLFALCDEWPTLIPLHITGKGWIHST